MTDRSGVRIGAVIAVAAVAGFLIWLLVIRDTGNGASSDIPLGQPTPLGASESDIAAMANEAGHTVYWAGSQPGTHLEATLLSNGRAYVRYLTGNAPIGSPKPNFLTVGTYPVQDAYKTLQVTSKQKGETVDKTGDGGLATQSKRRPKSVYIAYPNRDLQIEVYDPNPSR